MDTEVVPQSEVEDLLRAELAAQTLRDYFASDTKACQLYCNTWVQLKRSLDKKSMIPQFGVTPFRNTKQYQYTDLARSAQTGCRGCVFLKALVEAVFKAYPSLAQDAVLQWGDHKYMLEITNDSKPARQIQLFQPPGATVVIPYMATSSPLYGDTASQSSIRRAKAFIENCETSHPDCGNGRHVPLPSRLLNLAVIDDASGRTGIRLEETGGQIGTYACLSHCWGPPSLIKTKLTTATMAEYLGFISWDLLAPTFRDAITLTRDLGLTYLWIDSLCIIQDSSSDWEAESSRMGDIYPQSYVTIAAAASADSQGGCFQKAISDQIIRVRDKDEPGAIILGLRDCQGTGTVSLKDTARERLTPLFSRAWVYQERLLSRRTLFCGRFEYSLGCQEDSFCECASGRIAPHLQPGSTPNIAPLRKNAALRPQDPSSRGHDVVLQAYTNWNTMVKAYCRLRLTKGKDKLPAISACAKLAAQALQSDYLAGIWRVSLMEGLMWYVLEPLTEHRPRPPRAPSWSWASVDAPEGIEYISSHNTMSKAFAGKIEAAECVPVGSDPTGQVKSGFIRLRASLLPAHWQARCWNCTSAGGRKKSRGADFAILTTGNSQGRAGSVCTFSDPGLDVRGGSMIMNADALVEDLDAVGFGPPSQSGLGRCRVARIYLLHIHRFGMAGGRENKRGIHALTFLALREVSQPLHTGPVFERVGLVQLRCDTVAERVDWMDEVYSALILPEEAITLV